MVVKKDIYISRYYLDNNALAVGKAAGSFQNMVRTSAVCANYLSFQTAKILFIVKKSLYRFQNLVRTCPYDLNRSQNTVRTSPCVLISSGSPGRL